MKIVTSAQMRELDRLTVERTGISWSTLMETAGVRVSQEILARGECHTYAVLCGKDNNGGDGAVVARHLWLHGSSLVDVYLFGSLDQTQGEARVNLEIIRRLAEMQVSPGGAVLTFSEISTEQDADIPIYHDCVVDALFGSGLNRPAEGIYAIAIEAINNQKTLSPDTFVVAVDIPSGLSSDSGDALEPHVRADATVSLTAPKIGNVLPPASEANGKLTVASIGTPAEFLTACESRLYLVDDRDVVEWLRSSQRSQSAHKGQVGNVLVVAGSPGKTGAAALTSDAILRAGAGLVTVATSRAAQPLLISQARAEVMTEGLDETSTGSVSHEALAQALKLAEGRTVIAVGPGLSSQDPSTRAFVLDFVAQRTTPLIIDADGLNALSPWPESLKGSKELPIIITPHPGEMARLTGMSTREVLADRVSIARDFSVAHGVITVLKGSRSVIAAPSGEVYVNQTGNAGMATAGSGDVLTGIIAGFIAQQPGHPLEGTIAAVSLHGRAGDLAAARLGMRSVLASSIAAHLAEAILDFGI
ncbi:MAG: NAD(P)H-hydrate dehydratase [Acidobacteriota bacterium]